VTGSLITHDSIIDFSSQAQSLHYQISIPGLSGLAAQWQASQAVWDLDGDMELAVCD